jgi:hypothetical protein
MAARKYSDATMARAIAHFERESDATSKDIADALRRRDSKANKLLHALITGRPAAEVRRALEAASPGVLYRVQRNKVTGTQTTVLSEESGDLDVDCVREGDKYGVFCDDHGSVVHVRTLGAAKTLARDPTQFCDDCRAIEQYKTSVRDRD